MDGLGRERFKINKWLEIYNLWSGEVAWNCDGGKNYYREDQAKKKNMYLINNFDYIY